MTSEDDFQAALDANPEDWQTRLVFADWLQERGDPRADGYRALGTLRLWPTHEHVGFEAEKRYCPYWGNGDAQPARHANLPGDWYDVLELDGKGEMFAPTWTERMNATRRELEDAAALAFVQLPPERRAELLAAQPCAVPKAKTKKRNRKKKP